MIQTLVYVACNPTGALVNDATVYVCLYTNSCSHGFDLFDISLTCCGRP